MGRGLIIALAASLALQDGAWSVAFQSRLGRTPWIRPHTDAVLPELAQRGVRRLAIACPSFVADCLETLEEIAMQNAELFVESGGKTLNYIPALNDREDHVGLLSDLVVRHASGWPEFSANYDAETVAEARVRSRELAAAAGADS